jgi:DNA ligase-1
VTTLLATVVDVSGRVAQTGSRLAKRNAIAECLRRADADEVAIVVAFLSGETRQGRIGVGYATLAALRHAPAAAPSLTVGDVDAALARVAST